MVALFGTMVVLAFIPSVSVLAVSARSAAFGFAHGVVTAAGIVVGDIIYILLAIYGLSVLADLMGGNFALVKYLGGAYLIYLGITLWRSNSRAEMGDGKIESSLSSSFLSGLLITLADQKAILFYLGFFPAFIDLSRMTPADTLAIIVIAVVGVGGAKLVYAYLADRASQAFKNTRAVLAINTLAASVMIVVGLTLLLKTQAWI